MTHKAGPFLEIFPRLHYPSTRFPSRPLQILKPSAPLETFIHLYFYSARKETGTNENVKRGMKSIRLVTEGHCAVIGSWLGIGTKRITPIRHLLLKT